MKTKYALKALAHLANAPPNEPVVLAEIAAKEEMISRKFLEVILGELKQHGFVQSRKGRGGGYVLAAGGRREIANRDGHPVARRFARAGAVPESHVGTGGAPGCRDEATCGVRLVFQDMYDASMKILESTTLADPDASCRTGVEKEGPPVLRYFI